MISQTMWGACRSACPRGGVLGVLTGSSSSSPGAARGARSARAPRSADHPAPVVARRASPAHGQIDPVVLHPLQQVLRPATRSSHRSWVLLALGSSSSPATACACSPTWTLTPLTTRCRSASSHRRCLGRHQHLVEQPPRLADRVSRQVSSSRSPACPASPDAAIGSPRSSPSLSLSLVLDRYSLSLVQPSGADPPRSAGRPHVPPCRAAPTSTTCSSSASRGGALSPPVRLVGRGSPTGSSDLAYGRKPREAGSLSACRTTPFARCRWPG
jgi:hypothetical protein